MLGGGVWHGIDICNGSVNGENGKAQQHHHISTRRNSARIASLSRAASSQRPSISKQRRQAALKKP